MDVCTQCGQPLGIGRFCTNCGHPVDAPRDASEDDFGTWRTDTAERPRVNDPVEPLPVPELPEPPRYPLYADDVAAPAPPPGQTDRPSPVIPPPAPPPTADPGQDARTWLPWAVGIGIMVLVAGLGAWLLFGSDDDDPETATPAQTTAAADEESPPSVAPSSQKASPTKSPKPSPFAGNLAQFATISAPPPAPPGQGANGEVVRYDATNMVDDIPETTWRMAGDGTGESITFRFERPATLTEVGLVNGYAKVARDNGGVLDWYHGNRRIDAVEWTFEDGTVVRQELGDTTLMQSVRVKKVETSSVTLRLLEVTPPGRGRASRNYTAISEVSFLGTTS
jgi:hypothetical protein